MRYLAILCILAVAACTNTELNGLKALTVVCDSYATTLSTLAKFRKAGKLSDDQIRTVERVRFYATPACTGQQTENILSLVANLTEGVGDLVNIKKEVE